MIKVRYIGPEDHVVVSVHGALTKFKINEEKLISEIDLPKLLANEFHKFEKIEISEAKTLSKRGKNRILKKAGTKDGSEL